MPSPDKYRKGLKRGAAVVAGVVVIAIWLTNLHEVEILKIVLGICEMVLCAAVGGHVTMSIGQMIVDRYSKSDDTETYRVDPKDVDELPFR